MSAHGGLYFMPTDPSATSTLPSPEHMPFVSLPQVMGGGGNAELGTQEGIRKAAGTGGKLSLKLQLSHGQGVVFLV